MILAAKVAPPVVPASDNNLNELIRPVLENALGRKSVLFYALPGYLSTGRLAAVLFSKGSVFWLRATAEDADPASLYISLLQHVTETAPEVAAQAFQQIRSHPGPIYGWAQHFSALAHTLIEARRQPDSMVIEHINQMGEAPQSLQMLLNHFLPMLPGTTCALTAHQHLPQMELPVHLRKVRVHELKLDEMEAWKLADQHQVSLPAQTLRQVLSWTNGNEGLLAGVLGAGQRLGSAALHRVFENAPDTSIALCSLASCWLQEAPKETVQRLNLILRLGYLHPGMFEIQQTSGAGSDKLLDLPAEWLQSLAGGWVRLQCAWETPLRQALDAQYSSLPTGESVSLFEDALIFLIRQGLYEQAIPLLLAQGYFDVGARMIAQVVNPLLDRGQWNTLSAWLACIPEPIRQEWPWLLYAEAEINAVGKLHGNGINPAQENRLSWAEEQYANAAKRFLEGQDVQGAYTSLLTQSCLTAWQENLEQALSLAYQAKAMVASPEMPWYEGWADWQIACLIFQQGNLPAAQEHFDHALESAQRAADQIMIDLIEQARRLANHLVDVRQKKEQYRQALMELEQAEQRANLHLRTLIEGPSDGSETLLSAYGWSHTPLLLKMSTPTPGEPSKEPVSTRIANRLRGFFRLRENALPASTALARPEEQRVELHRLNDLTDIPILPAQPPFTNTPPRREAKEKVVTTPNINGDETGQIAVPHVVPEMLHLPITGEPEPQVTEHQGETHHLVEEAPSPPVLQAYLLGSLRVRLNETFIDHWPSGRGHGVFAYLLARQGEPVSREVIRDIFWPDASPEASRNNLNVVIHSLRRQLKTIWEDPIILFQSSVYRINPAVTLWLDFIQFERHARTGQTLEKEGKPSQAIQEYERALELYQGDFLADSPYEDWAAVERERLRVLSLEILDHLSLVYFGMEAYPTSAALCLRILQRDNCREDSHCRLMRCYSRMGQPHLAIRQYHACQEALRTELDVAPSPATVQLYERIRFQQNV